MSGNNRQSGTIPHEYRLFCLSLQLLILDLIRFVCAQNSQENTHKEASKNALLNDKFSRAFFGLALFVFPQEIILTFLAVITGMYGLVQIPFEVFVPDNLPGVKLLPAQIVKVLCLL